MLGYQIILVDNQLVNKNSVLKTGSMDRLSLTMAEATRIEYKHRARKTLAAFCRVTSMLALLFE